ncbi:MAG: DUF2156 domain-containing protein [bacterium]|nr:DUF2156 domain-containing protein [bacterium]
MKKEKLGLHHKDLLYSRMRDIPTRVSEYSFSNLYLFRETHQYEVIEGEDVFVSGVTYNGLPYIMPTRDTREIDINCIRKVIKEHGTLFPIPEEWLEGFDPEEFIFTYDDGETDYIHTIEKLATYAGRNLHKKRNLLKQFRESYTYEALPLTDDRLPDAKWILDEWQKGIQEAPEETDFAECGEALKLYDELILCGGIYYVDKEPAGFVLGDELNDKTFALHFAKARRKFKGIYQFIFNNFASIMPAQYCCFNFEQDLGKESLRQAKATYKPEAMIKKYRVGIR